jgi:uncharacterized protein YqjF (DUF2071 family)
MTDVRIRGTPALPWLSSFPELNVRTYVTVNGKPGVYFFSHDAGNRIAVEVARTWFHLPYFHARMSFTCVPDGTVNYQSTRVDPRSDSAELLATYGPVGAAVASTRGSIEAFLTERYALFTTDPKGRLYYGDIHHRQWPLQAAGAEFECNTLLQATGLDQSIVTGEPLLHFSKRLDVLIWPLRRAQ